MAECGPFDPGDIREFTPREPTPARWEIHQVIVRIRRSPGHGQAKATGRAGLQDHPDILQKWQNRTRLNIRYFLGLEKWVNEQRAKTEYKPAPALFGV